MGESKSWISPLPSNFLLIYDPAKDSWKTGTALPVLSGQGVAGVLAGKLYVLTPQDGFAYSGQNTSTFMTPQLAPGPSCPLHLGTESRWPLESWMANCMSWGR
jgi:hypothetical protein